MSILKHNTIWVGIVYFLILLSIAFWVRDIPHQQDSFNTIQQLINASRMGDPVSFATAALDIAKNGWISPANNWILNLWPPGFILLEALILKVIGFSAPIVLILQILAAGLFSIVLLLLYSLLKASLNRKLALILPLIIFAFPVSRVFLLEPTGVSLGESFAVGFLMLGVLLILRSVTQRSLCCAVYAGLCLAMAAYFRSQFELILLALTGWGILIVVVIRFSRLQIMIEPTAVRLIVKTIALTLLVAHVATAPWRIYHFVHPHFSAEQQKFVRSPAWVYTSQLIYENSVQTTEYLYKNSGGFVVLGGGNLVCRINPTTCGDTVNAQKLFIKTFIQHPIEWYSLKMEVIGKYWFSSIKNWTWVKQPSTSVDIIINGLLLIALILLVYLMFNRKVRSHDLWILLVWFNLSLFSTYIIIFTLVHLEVRYFNFPKIATMLMLILVISMYYQPMKNVRTNDI